MSDLLVEPPAAVDRAELRAASSPSVLPATAKPPVVVIERRSRWQLIDFGELWHYRDLFRFLVWRDVKVLYAQSALGIGWAIVQPLATMAVLAIVFGYFAEMPSDGVAYPVFSLAALVPWTYFSNAVTGGVGSLVNEANLLRKVYFPRLLLPFSAVAAKLVDFGIALVLLFVLMTAYGLPPTWRVLFLPALVLLMMMAAAGIAVWLTALAVQYRDVKHGMTFLMQLMMYAAPVVYPASVVPDRYRAIYDLNPMVGVIEGFRWSLLKTGSMPIQSLAIGSSVACVLLLTGLFYFRQRERLFADVA